MFEMLPDEMSKKKSNRNTNFWYYKTQKEKQATYKDLYAYNADAYITYKYNVRMTLLQ